MLKEIASEFLASHGSFFLGHARELRTFVLRRKTSYGLMAASFFLAKILF
jgi:hypothetical protein